MAEFVQPPDQQDPDALKKALLAKLFGGPIPGAVPPPGTPQRSLTGTPDPGTPPTAAPPATTQPNASATPTATPLTAAAGPQPAKPLANASPIQPGEAQPFPTKDVYDQQNPLPAHTPYVAPDFKHRLLMGIFGGMQEFGRPGEGAKTVRDYLGDIARRTDEEKNYPTTAAAQQQQRYLAAGQAAQHINIDDPQNPGQPKIVNFDQHTGAFIDPDTHLAIPGAKPWEKPEHATPPTIKYDSGVPVEVTGNGKTYSIHDPALPPDLKPLVDSALTAHKQHMSEQEESQKRVAGFSADRQGRTFAEQEKMFQEHQDAPTAATKTMIEAVPKVHELIAKLRPLADAEAQGGGPIGARWSDFWSNKAGAPNEQYSRMRVDDGLLATALMKMHMGSRGGELMMQHFTNLLGLAHQSPQNYKAALDEIDSYANDVGKEGHGGDHPANLKDQKGASAAPANPKDPLGIL